MTPLNPYRTGIPGHSPPAGDRAPWGPSTSCGCGMPVAGSPLRIALGCCAVVAALVATMDAARATPAGPGECLGRLAALDAGGQVVFETVALLTERPGVAAAPLHPLE